MITLVGVPRVQQAWGEAHVTDTSFAPTGNYLASGLKRIYNDTSNIFPPSSHGSRVSTRGRWKSLMRTDFTHKNIREAWIRGEKPRTSLPIDDPDCERSKMFMQWRIPQRITQEGDKPGNFNRLSISRSDSPLKSSMEERQHMSRSGHQSRSQTGRQSRSESGLFGGHTPHMPVIHTSHGRSETRCSSTGGSRIQATPLIRSPLPCKSAPTVTKSKAAAKNEFLSSYADHSVPSKADQMLRYASPGEKRQIQKALRIAAECSKPVVVKEVVSKWMSSASDRDHKVALDFFQSIAGSKLLGEDDVKAQQIVDQLKRGGLSGLDAAGRLPLDPDEEARLRYIRLLTPTTRKNKGLHQTWHHLPSYRNDNRVKNNSGIYNVAQSHVPRHFVIHPDWG